MVNPYVASNPVGPHDFAGREEEIRTVMSHVQASRQGHHSNIFVEGEWGIGKTSLLLKLEPSLLEASWVVYTSIQEGREHFERLMRSIFQGILNQATDLWGSDSIPDRSLLEGTDRYIDLLKRMYDAIKERIDHAVILIDNAENASPRTFSQLREVFQNLSIMGCKFMLVASGTRLPIGKPSASNPVSRFFHTIPLGPLSFEDSIEAVRKPLRPTLGFAFTDDGIRQVFERTEGHPYFLKLVCHHVFALAKGEGTVGEEWIAIHWDKIADQLYRAKFANEFDPLPQGERYTLMRASLLPAEEFQRKDLKDVRVRGLKSIEKSIDTYLTRLKGEDRRLLISVGHGRYRFYHRLFREAVRVRALPQMQPPKSDYIQQGRTVLGILEIEDWIRNNVVERLWILDQHFRDRAVQCLEVTSEKTQVRVLMGEDQAWPKTKRLLQQLPERVKGRVEVRAWAASQKKPVPFHLRLLIADEAVVALGHSLDQVGRKATTMTDQGKDRKLLVADYEKWWTDSKTVFPA